MKKIKEKLHSKKGESISEVLVSALIVAMAFVMVANLVSIAYSTLRHTDENMSAFYAERNAFEKGTSETSDGTVTIGNGTGANTTSISSAGIAVTITYETVGAGDNANLYVSYEKKAGS